MKKFVLENKLVSLVLTIVLGSIVTYSILFGQWTVNEIYCGREKLSSHINVQIAEDKKISEQVKEVKEEVKDVKDAISTMKKEMSEESIKVRKENADNQATLLKLLIDIKRGK